jgi:tetratricopeptide (TPR) repeat protein
MRVATIFSLLALLLGPGEARAVQKELDDPHPDRPLGSVHLSVSCEAAVQSRFDRAVALLHHMTYPEARKAFADVAAGDSGCAMAYWGIALTLFQPLWPTRPGPEDLEAGWEAVQRAKALAPPTDREQRYIAAAEAFFLEPDSADYWTRIQRWERAMEELHRAHPEDQDAAAFYALALLAIEPPTDRSGDHRERAARILLDLQRQEPTHPGAIHYLIHANDAPGRERESLDVVRGYASIAPDNPHALHMPTHVFVRLGSWEEVIDGNRSAAEAALEHRAGDRGQYVWDEYPHAVEYLVYAYLQRGEDSAAADALDRLRAIPNLEPSFKTAFHSASIPARLSLERKAWAEAAALRPREPGFLDWDRFPWPEAVTWFARGIGSARLGNPVEARRAAERLRELRDRARSAGEELFARQIEVLRLEVSGWLSHVDGGDEEALRLLREAAELEATTPKHAVTPAPTLPADELLGDLLMEIGRPREALEAYERSLQKTPRRLNGLAGAGRAASAIGDRERAAAHYRELLEVTAQETDRSGVLEARRYLGEVR